MCVLNWCFKRRIMSKRPSFWFYKRTCLTVSVAGLWFLVYWLKYWNTIGYVGLPSGFSINTEGCRIPNLDPFDPSVRRFLFDEEDPGCEETYGPPLVGSDATTLFINKSALFHYNVRDAEELRCCYTPFWRLELSKTSSSKYRRDDDTQTRFANSCTDFTDRVKVADEFVKVQCFLKSFSGIHSVYSDFHAFVPKKPTTTERKAHDFQRDTNVSVLILGVDTVSRLNLYRQMPLTLEFLKKQLKAVEFFGHNKVEDNTFVNMIPVLTGLSHEELKKSCWKGKGSVFDDCRFVWDRFREGGYRTVFSEDAHSRESMFHHTVFQSFRKPPTDYYTGPFFMRADKDIGFKQISGSKLCLGPRLTLEVLMDYAFKFAIATKDVLSFGLFWSSTLTHDYFNVPKRGDVLHRELLKKLHRENVLNRTVLVFMSDHGMRWGKVRETYLGYFEERLPFLFVSYPEWFEEEFTAAVGNLKKNSLKLTTPFDLHETLLDLVNLTRLQTEVLKGRSEILRKTKRLPRGISLFLPIPGDRTCKDADIADHWCACHESESVPTDSTAVVIAAKYTVDHINSLLRDYPQCARLNLTRTAGARMEKATSLKSSETSDSGLTDYTMTLETLPGRALFESTVRHNENTDKFIIVGAVSRINQYGNQSVCIDHDRLRLYCYCI